MEKRLDHETIPFIDDKDAWSTQDTVTGPPTCVNPPVHLEMEEPKDIHMSGSFGDVRDVAVRAKDTKRTSTEVETLGENGLQKRGNSFKYPLHSAAEKGKVKVLERLLVKGDPFITDFKQRTPLHYACGFPYQKKVLRMIDAILNSPQAQDTPEDQMRKLKLINFQDKEGETGLHIAARTGHSLAVEKLLFSAADVNLRDKNNIEPLELIYHKVPQSMIPVFDGAVECEVGDPNDQNLIVRLDFGSIVGYPEPEKMKTKFEMETKLLYYCLRQSEKKRSAILLHPIVQVFLFLKWKKVRILLWISILYHLIWLLLYTLFITTLYLKLCPYRKNSEEDDISEEILSDMSKNDSLFLNESSQDIESGENYTTPLNATSCEFPKDLLSSLSVELTFLFLVSVSVAFKELYEICSTPELKLYFLQLENVGQWLLVGVVGLTALPLFTITDGGDDKIAIFIYSWQYQVAALGIFLAWSLILSQIGKIPRFGIYIEMLGKVLKSFAMFMITFASLLVAFTVSFQILMPEKAEFREFPWGFMKVMVMMVGEVNYDDVFHDDDSESEIPFPASTKLLYSAFVSIVTIILFNLLIGLTVSDTQGLQNGAQLTSLSSQLDQIYLLEKFLFSKKFQNWLEQMNKRHWLRYFLVTQQTDNVETNMGKELHISEIPRNLQHQVRDVAIPNVKQEDEEDDDEEFTGPISTENADKSSDTLENVTTDSTNRKSSAVPSADTATDLREQIKDILRELLEELKHERQSNIK